MTRRERMEKRVADRAKWAESRDAKAAQDFKKGDLREEVSGIPFGQPILVGHHSERRHRNVIDKARRAMGRAVEHSNKADEHRSKAESLRIALDKSIYSDDEDAIDKLEARIALREEASETMRTVNKLYRKGDAEGLAAMGFDLEKLREGLKDAYSWCKMPYPSYTMSNLRGRIASDKKRLDLIKWQQANKEKAEADGGVHIDDNEPDNPNAWIRVTFSEKPERDVLNALREAGFRWGAGSWVGPRAKLPEVVKKGAIEA